MHRSYVDTLAVGVSLKTRRFRAMAKYELFFVPLIGRAIALGGGFPVRRGVQDMEAYEKAHGLLREGDMLLVFPEGTRNRDGKARPQLGAARLALEAGAAFVPVSIAGSERIKLMPPRFPKIRVHYGQPVPLGRSARGRPAAGIAHGDEALDPRPSRPASSKLARSDARGRSGGALVEQALAVLVQPGLVPRAHTGGLVGVGDLEREADLACAERQRDDAGDPRGDPAGLVLGLPVADVPRNVDGVTDERRAAGPAGPAAAVGDVEADGVDAAALGEHGAAHDLDEHGRVVDRRAQRAAHLRLLPLVRRRELAARRSSRRAGLSFEIAW